MKRLVTLHFLVPASVACLGMALIVIGFLRNKHHLAVHGQAALWSEAYQEGTRLSHVAEHLLRKRLIQTTDLEMSYIGMSSRLDLAVICDSDNVVRHASHMQWRGIPLAETPLRAVVPVLKAVRDEMSGQVLIADHGKNVWAVFPFFDRSVTAIPVVILSYDLESVLIEAGRTALNESVAQSLGLLGGCLLLWLFLDITITSRIARIVDYAKEVALGRSPPPPRVAGDEIGAVGAAFADAVTQLRETELQLLEASEKERRRVGMDLHDDVCQRIAAAQLKAGVLGAALGKADSPHRVLAQQVAEELADAAEIARGFARGLAPASLDRDGLNAALKDQAKHLGKIFSIKITCETDARVQGLPESVQMHLFRIAQELVTNAAKHAKAGFIHVRMSLEENRVRLEVENDGASFTAETGRRGGMGLRLVGQRLRAIHGRLVFTPRPDGGTVALCEVPVSGIMSA